MQAVFTITSILRRKFIMQQIRIIELPRMKVVKSGPIRTEQAFNAFNKWFSDYHAALPCELSPRDFMWYNERKQATEWVYALPTGADETDCGGYAVESRTGLKKANFSRCMSTRRAKRSATPCFIS